jgi:hypothetical protein
MNARSAFNVLPANLWRRVATVGKVTPELARFFSLPKQRTLPLLKLTPAVQRNRKLVNRSKIMSYFSAPSKFGVLDVHNPAAYKNKEWKYYFRPSQSTFVFFNTKNGPPVLINKKTGERLPNSKQKYIHLMNRLGLDPDFRFNLKPRHPKHHTWNAYLRRLREAPRPDIHHKCKIQYDQCHS